MAVRSYLEKGGPITIDDQVLFAHPVESNRDFYLEYQNSSSVTLIRIAESDVLALMSCFKHIQRFTVIHMLILDDISAIPKSLTELTLINVQVEHPLFQKVLLNSKDTLKSLYLDQVKTFLSSNGCFYFKHLCPNLKSLVVKTERTNIRSHVNPNLSIVTSVSPDLIRDLPPTLESLYYDSSWKYLPFGHLNRLECLTLKHWNHKLIAPSNLKHLKLLKAFDHKYKSYFDNLNLESTEIVYYNEPVADLPGPNLILETLNDDCLCNVIPYLALEDIISFAGSHPRVQGVIARQGVSLEDIRNNSKALMESREFWEETAPSLRLMSVTNIANRDLLWLLPRCTGLKHLFMGRMNFTDDFQRRFSDQLIRNPNQLKNLTQLYVDTCVDVDCLLLILRRNKETLEVFCCTVDMAEDWVRFEEIWEVVAGMELVKDVLLGKRYTGSIGQVNYKHHVARILSLVGRKLKVFCLCGLDDCVDLLNVAQLPEVRALTLDMRMSPTKKNWATLSAFEELEDITIHVERDVIDPSYILELVKMLPRLSEITIDMPSNEFPLRFGVELNKYLAQKNRVLRIQFGCTY